MEMNNNTAASLEVKVADFDKRSEGRGQAFKFLKSIM